MTLNTSAILKVIIVALAIGLGFGIKYITSSQVIDTAVEHVAEEVIKDETGLDINFTGTK